MKFPFRLPGRSRRLKKEPSPDLPNDRDVLRFSNYHPREVEHKRNWLRFRQKQVKDFPVTDDFRKQRQARKLNEVGRKFLNVLGTNKRKLIAVIVVICLLGGGALIYNLINNQKVIALETITVDGNEQIKVSDITALLQPYIGKPLTAFSSSEIEAKILQAFPYVKAAFASKVLPKSLHIEIEERYPIFAFVNISGVFLVDEDQRVILSYAVNAVPSLTADQILVMQGYGDFNANYTKERYLASITDVTERSKVKWEDVPEDNKKDALNQLRSDLLAQTDSKLAAHLAALGGSKFNNVPIIKSWNADVYPVSSSFPKADFDLLNQLLTYSRASSMKLTEILWQSDFSILVSVDGSASLLFTTSRPMVDQFAALEALKAARDITGLQLIDLRSEVIAVR